MTYYLYRDEINHFVRQDERGAYELDCLKEEWLPFAKDLCNAEELSEKQAETYLLALHTAKKAHEGQKDKAGSPYITHPITVSSFTEGSFTAVTAALLHDVAEDTPLSLDGLRELGFDEDIVNCVGALTMREGEERRAYIERAAANPDAICVKLADLKHNSDLSRLPAVTEKDLKRLENYRKETAYLKGILARRSVEKHEESA